MTQSASIVRPSVMILALRRLPFGAKQAVRIYNRLLMLLAPRQVATTYFGARMRVDMRDFLQATIFHFGTWEPAESQLLDRFIRPGDTALDIGANVGFHSLLFATRVGPEGRVIAIEAHPRLAERIAEQLQLNQLANVRIVNVAVSDKAGEVLLYEGPSSNSGATSIMASRRSANSIKVRAAPIMSLLSPEEIAQISLIKIDIEGAEGPVLRDLLDHIDQFPKLLAFAVEANSDEDDGWPAIFDRFLAAGFSAFRVKQNYDWASIVDEQRVEPVAIRSLPSGSADILFVRGASWFTA